MYKYNGLMSYSYSPYEGIPFLEEYNNQRKSVLKMLEKNHKIEDIKIKIKDQNTIDDELKKFEVKRKSENLYELSLNCLYFYQKTGNLKYLNCSLKINDFLTANIEKEKQPSWLHRIITTEQLLFNKLLESQEVKL